MAVYIVSAVYFYTLPSQAHTAEITVKGSYEDETFAVEEFTTEPSETPKNGKIREMKGIAESEVECEQETKEKKTAKSLVTKEAQIVLAIQHDLDEEERKDQTDTENEAQTETDCENQNGKGEEESAETYGITIYSFGEEMIEPYLQVMLYEALDRHEISYWYEIGLCQLWQESKGKIYVVNESNGVDSGILQYRATYFDYSRGDIFDPAVQFDLYAEQMSARLNQGLSAEECISRHITSDYVTEMDWQYVSDVKQHLPNLRKVN